MQKAQALKQAADARNTLYEDSVKELQAGRLSLDIVTSRDFDRQQATSAYLGAQMQRLRQKKGSPIPSIK